ncbi:hypothetical protein M569_10150 [Genlisea aurea]|uniref:Cytochrome P450 n=1 Tax=Genlisea aurea TaxID=192259 RepID=S8DXD4_9LAMI|nr:hypothetical protein M569_10150 [Genlisea aurea]
MPSSSSLFPSPPITILDRHYRERPPRRRNASPLLAVKKTADGPPPSAKTPTSWVSPDWLTSVSNSVASVLGPKDESNIPVAGAKLEDVSELLGGALFLPLFKWMNQYGPIYRLAAGPRNFVVVSDPSIARHVLRNYGTKYGKGLVAEVSEFLFGSGFAIAEDSLWTVRRRAVVPSLHKKFLSVIVERVFCRCAERLVEKLKSDAMAGDSVNMEEKFSQLTLDVIGLALFNYNFDSLTSNSPVIDAINALCKIIPRQIKAERAVSLIRETVEGLIAKCRDMVESQGERIGEEEGDDYVNENDPSVLRFLLASREEVSSSQLRDDLLSMLVAGHETTGSVLTWTCYLLSKDGSLLRKAQEEVDRVLQGKLPTYESVKNLRFLTNCIMESMRLYPHPPVLLRRARVADTLPGNYKVEPGQDIMISVYNIHRSSQVWDRAEEFVPDRFDVAGPVPNETNTDFKFIPFSGGPRKCVGDQFALLEATVGLAVVLQRLDFELVPDQIIGMTTGATIHTTNGLFMKVSPRRTPSYMRQKSNKRLSCSKEKFDFRFSDFHALQIPKGWDRLVLSLETGKSISKLEKAIVRNGSCQWRESVSESIYLSGDDEAAVVKIVVSTVRCRSQSLFFRF